MGLTGFNNARRIQAMAAKAVVAPEMPLESPVTAVAVESEPECVLGITPALEVINGATVASDIAILPSIGKGASEVILANRPEGGYTSLCQLWALNEEILNRPYRTNKEAVESYGLG